MLRKMLVSGNTDILTQISSENQSLTFKGMIEFLARKGIYAVESEQFLKNYWMFNKDCRYNYMAYLLSDQNEMSIKVMRFDGLDKSVVNERMRFSGQSLLVSVQEVLDYFKLINLPSKVDLASGIRSEVSLFDFQSFREAWINACVHNTWTEQIPPSIYIYDDRIEIVSYGGIPYGLSEEGFFAGTSKPVNKRLFNIFIACNFSEQSGHGIPQIVSVYGKEVFSFRDGLLIVTIPFGYEPDYVKSRKIKTLIENKLTNNQKLVLTYYSDHPQATMKEVAEACSISLGGVKKIVSKLTENNLIRRNGAKNKPVWIVMK